MYDAIVIGGGIAGASSAIMLSSSGHKVLLLEKGDLPAHKICGEFLSTEAASLLQRLGVFQEVVSAGAAPISDVFITTQRGRSWRAKLPGIAYGLSRFHFDKILFDHARKTGAECHTRVSALDVAGNLDDGFVVKTSDGDFSGRLVIGAYGKKAYPVKGAGKQQKENCSDLVGFKQHFTGAGPVGTVEVHTFDGGYCGINTIEDGTVNVCWLTSRRVLKSHGGRWETMAAAVLLRNSFLKERLARLQPVEGTFCAVAGVSLARKGTFADDVCLVGDAAQMIAPFCGDGMGMALRASSIATPLCSLFLAGEISRRAFLQKYTNQWNEEFGMRIKLGQALQTVAMWPHGADIALCLVGLAPAAGDWLIRHTRMIVRKNAAAQH